MFFVGCNTEKKQLDMLEIDLANDWSEISKLIELKQGTNNTSEYLNSYYTKNINDIKIDKLTLSTEKSKKSANTSIPTENQINFLFKDDVNNQLVEIEIDINYLESDTLIFNLITKKYGQGKLLSKKGSISEIKEIQNYLWNNLDYNQSLILSTFFQGNIYDVETNSNKKQYSNRIYLVNNNAEISYPNGQKENILERLINRMSR